MHCLHGDPIFSAALLYAQGISYHRERGLALTSMTPVSYDIALPCYTSFPVAQPHAACLSCHENLRTMIHECAWDVKASSWSLMNVLLKCSPDVPSPLCIHVPSSRGSTCTKIASRSNTCVAATHVRVYLAVSIFWLVWHFHSLSDLKMYSISA